MPDTLKFLIIPYSAQLKIIFLLLLTGEIHLTCNVTICMIGFVPLGSEAQMISDSCELLKLVLCLSQ